MDNKYFQTLEFIRMYKHKEIVLGRYPLEKKFKDLQKSYELKLRNWKWSMGLSTLFLYFIIRPLGGKLLTFCLWLTLSLTSISYYFPSDDYHEVSSLLYHKYKPMSDFKLKYTYYQSIEKRNNILAEIFNEEI